MPSADEQLEALIRSRAADMGERVPTHTADDAEGERLLEEEREEDRLVLAENSDMRIVPYAHADTISLPLQRRAQGVRQGGAEVGNMCRHARCGAASSADRRPLAVSRQ